MAGDYKKIASGARPGRISTSRLSLWRGPDHLLQIDRDHYIETYRRFYYSDIEVFTVRLDNRRRNFAVILGILIALCLLFAVAASSASIFFFIMTGFFLVPFIYNMVRGPTCVVYVATAVQREELQSVRRLKGAMRLLQVIRDGAALTQGVLAPDMVRVNFELKNAPAGSIPPAIPIPSIDLPPPPTPASTANPAAAAPAPETSPEPPSSQPPAQ
jgi:hypothetical protein